MGLLVMLTKQVVMEQESIASARPHRAPTLALMLAASPLGRPERIAMIAGQVFSTRRILYGVGEELPVTQRTRLSPHPSWLHLGVCCAAVRFAGRVAPLPQA